MRDQFFMDLVKLLSDECYWKAGEGPFYDVDQIFYLDAADVLADLHDYLQGR